MTVFEYCIYIALIYFIYIYIYRSVRINPFIICSESINFKSSFIVGQKTKLGELYTMQVIVSLQPWKPCGIIVAV